ncbi:hypothetical protein MKY92_23650 [Paenibacillus sp. FSL R5-0623]|uniref:hypothetical protein n=1 Tax=Paenibacillus sp. FSL R5-0623 TaxID=2921651 RepID=UPI0030D92C42
MVRRSIRFVSTTSQSRLQGEYPSWNVLKRSFLREAFLRSGDENPNGSSEHPLHYMLYVAAGGSIDVLTNIGHFICSKFSIMEF